MYLRSGGHFQGEAPPDTCAPGGSGFSDRGGQALRRGSPGGAGEMPADAARGGSPVRPPGDERASPGGCALAGGIRGYLRSSRRDSRSCSFCRSSTNRISFSLAAILAFNCSAWEASASFPIAASAASSFGDGAGAGGGGTEGSGSAVRGASRITIVALPRDPEGIFERSSVKWIA